MDEYKKWCESIVDEIEEPEFKAKLAFVASNCYFTRKMLESGEKTESLGILEKNYPSDKMYRISKDLYSEQMGSINVKTASWLKEAAKDIASRARKPVRNDSDWSPLIKVLMDMEKDALTITESESLSKYTHEFKMKGSGVFRYIDRHYLLLGKGPIAMLYRKNVTPFIDDEICKRVFGDTNGHDDAAYRKVSVLLTTLMHSCDIRMGKAGLELVFGCRSIETMCRVPRISEKNEKANLIVFGSMDLNGFEKMVESRYVTMYDGRSETGDYELCHYHLENPADLEWCISKAVDFIYKSRRNCRVVIGGDVEQRSLHRIQKELEPYNPIELGNKPEFLEYTRLYGSIDYETVEGHINYIDNLMSDPNEGDLDETVKKCLKKMKEIQREV